MEITIEELKKKFKACCPLRKEQCIGKSRGGWNAKLPKENRRNPWDYDKELYKNAMRLNDFSADTNAFEGYAHGMTNLISCL